MKVLVCNFKHNNHVIASTVVRKEQLVHDTLDGAFRHPATLVEIHNNCGLPVRSVMNLRYCLSLIGAELKIIPISCPSATFTDGE